MILWKRVWALIAYVIVWIYLILAYINEVVPKKINNEEWYMQTTYYIGLFLVFVIPFLIVVYFIEKDKQKDNQ